MVVRLYQPDLSGNEHRIVGNASHDRLLEICLLYRLLWDKQSRSFL